MTITRRARTGAAILEGLRSAPCAPDSALPPANRAWQRPARAHLPHRSGSAIARNRAPGERRVEPNCPAGWRHDARAVARTAAGGCENLRRAGRQSAPPRAVYRRPPATPTRASGCNCACARTSAESLERRRGPATGYFECRWRRSASRAPYQVPLHALPDDLATRKLPVDAPADRHAAGRAGRAEAAARLAWVADPLDALLQAAGAAGSSSARPARRRRCAWPYAGHNDQPTRSVGRWLIPSRASCWQAPRGRPSGPGRAPIRKRLNELPLWEQPALRLREEPLPRPQRVFPSPRARAGR